MKYIYTIYKSPIGLIYLVSDGKYLNALAFAKNWKSLKKNFPEIINQAAPIFRLAEKQLDQYFLGKRKQFSIPYVLKGTEFQIASWKSLLDISYGSTCSYSEQAKLIRRPKAVRAVGSANGKNPLCIIIPCHRVVAKNNKIGGYAGGIPIKQFLLNLEAHNK